MGGRGPFRFWFYIRQGWSTYFAFAIGMINTVTLTYYLAVENYPALNDVFPSFAQYALVVVAASIPLVALMGYVHYKKSPSYRSDVDIMMESNPYALRMKTNSETTLGLTLEVLSLVAKLSEGGRLSAEEKARLARIRADIAAYLEKRPAGLENMRTAFDEHGAPRD